MQLGGIVRRAASPPVWLAVVLGPALALRVWLLTGGQIDYDEGVYWQSLRAMAAGHPLFTSVYSSQPPAFLLLLAPAHVLLGGSIAGDRLTVLLLAAAGVAAVLRTAYVLGGPATGLAAGLLAAASLAADPLFLRESVTLQADGPAASLAAIAVALAAEARSRWPGRGRTVLPAAAGAVAAVAILTKLTAIAALPALALLLLAPEPGSRPPLRPLLAALAGGILAAAALLLPFAGAWPEMWRQAVGFHLTARALPAGGLDDPTRLREVPLTLLGTIGFLGLRRRVPLLAAAGAAWTAAAALLLVVQHPLWPHHVAALAPPLALLGGGVATLVPRRAALAALAALLLVAGSAASARYVRATQRPVADTRPLVAALCAATAPGDLVITDDEFAAALAGRSTPPALVDTSYVRIASGDLTLGQVETVAETAHVRAVLLGTGRLSALPGLMPWLEPRFPVITNLGGGRLLFVRPATPVAGEPPWPSRAAGCHAAG